MTTHQSGSLRSITQAAPKSLLNCSQAALKRPSHCCTGLRELDATFEHKKPYFIMHEADEDRGGMPLLVLRKDFESVRPDAATKLFSDSTPIITWHRVQDYQLMSLRMIAELVVHEMPSYSDLKQPPKLFLRGNILSKSFRFKVKPTVYVSANNPGAMEMADEIHGKYGTVGLTISRQMPPEFAAYDISNMQPEEDEASADYSPGNMRHLLLSTASTTCTHMLLYLCKETFVGDAGRRLAHEIREANRMSLRIVMVHECDPDKNGCPFAQFFRTTPEDLISGGLYGAIANALHQEPHRQISLASLAVSFGAVESKSTLAGKLRQTYSRPRRCESKGSLTQVVEVTAPAGLPSFSV